MKKTPKNAALFECILCDFKCSKKSDYIRHTVTRKHNYRTNLEQKTPKNAVNTKPETNIDSYVCDCGKLYKARNSLWYHKKKCKTYIENIVIKKDGNNEADFVINKELVLSVLKQNNELLKENNDFKNVLSETHNQVIELLKNGTHTTNNNKTFNLNLFLNETCKDAMNIMDFVNSLQLELCDLEKMGDVGYVTGITNIIIKNLNDMDVTERPVHCTDIKRETLYIKDENKWDKEVDEKPKIRKAIKHVARKNALLLQEFKDKYPDCIKSESKYSDTYNKLMIEAMGGKGFDNNDQENKIIKKITKEIILNK